jgi:serine protease
MRLFSSRLLAVAVTALLLAGVAPTAFAEPAPPAPLRLERLPAPEVPKAGSKPARDADTVLVKFAAGATEASEDAALDRSGAEEIGTAGATGYEVAELDADTTPEEAVRDLEDERIVEDAQVNYVRESSALPNDPALFYGDQEYLKTIRLPAAWDLTKGTSTKTIAILDTGIDTNHPDLASRIKPGYNALTGGTNVNDLNGHGTFVAGVAAGISNNGRGIAGAAWAAGILPVKVLGDNGTGNDADIAEGITWAANHGASVINLSLGGPGFSNVLNNAINYAFSKNVIVIAAAGNDGRNEANYPAAFGGVIAVTATDTDLNGSFAAFSNYGWWVDVAAPGMNIVSTLAGSGEQYAIGDGTSFAAPLVSGIAFLMRLRFPNMAVGTINYRLRNTAQDHGPSGFDPFYGAGRVDAYAALGGPKLAPRAPVTNSLAEPNDSFDRAASLLTSASSAIAPEGDADWWRREVTTPGVMTVSVDPDPAFTGGLYLDAVIEAYAPDGTLIGSVDQTAYNESEFLTVTTAVPGSYRIRVTNYLGSRSPGNYVISAFTSAESGPPVVGVQSWISDQSPADFATGVATSVQPALEFHRVLDPATVNGQTVALLNGNTMLAVPASLAYDAGTRTVTITPSSPLAANTPYIVAAWLVQDLAAAYMTAVHTHRFKTAA